jgi:hypothetical protein
MAETIVEGMRRGVGAQTGWMPRWVMAAAVEPRGAAAESPDVGRSARDGALASGIGKSRRRRREPAVAVKRRGVVTVEPCGAAAESPDAGRFARDGASAGHDGRGNRRGAMECRGVAAVEPRGAATESSDVGESAQDV